MKRGVHLGLIGSVLLSVAYLRLFAFRFLSPEWAIAVLVLGGLAVATFIAAGRFSSKWWYLGVLLGLLSMFLVLAFSWG